MKKLKLFCALLLLALSSFAQSTKPISTNLEQYSQAWNIDNDYFGTVTTNNLGSQMDSANAASGSVYFTISGYSIDNEDFEPIALNGTGSITLIAASYHASLTSTVQAVTLLTPECSADGVIWCKIPGVTVATLTTTSATVPVTTKWDFPISNGPGKLWRYGRVKTVTSADTAMLQCWFYFQKAAIVNIANR